MATFTGQAATNNSFTGTAGADVFQWAAANLNNLDRAAGAGGMDLFQLTSGGVLAANALAGVSGIERFVLAAAGSGITLANANYAGVAGAQILIKGGAGNDTLNGAGLSAANTVDVTAGAGVDDLRGGAGADRFRFAAPDLRGDTVVGGAGRDTLLLSTAGAVAATGLNGVAGVEVFQFAGGGNAITLRDANFVNVAGARIIIRGGAGADAVDGSSITGARAIDVTAGAGADEVIGGAGRDVFRFTENTLTSADTVNGGAGLDRLVLTGGGTLPSTAFNGVSGVETIQLASGGNGITLGNANFAGVAGARIIVRGSALGDTVNGAGLTGPNRIDVTAGTGVDVLTGGAGRDVFRFKAGDMSITDTVQGGGGSDTLLITTAGTITAGQLLNVSGVETIQLASGVNGIGLSDANVADGSTIAVIGNSGSDTVDGSGLTGNRGIEITAGAGADVLRGGAGADTFRFAATDLSGDTITGSAGFDRLQITTEGALATDALALVNGIDEIILAAGGNTITLIGANLSEEADRFDPDTWQIGVTGSAGSSTIDASALAGSHGLRYTGGGGADTVLGANGIDDFRFSSSAFDPASSISGGDGFPDAIYFGRSMDFLGNTITGVEGLYNYFGGATTVAVSGENAARLTAMGNLDNDGLTQTFNILLAPGSTTDLSNLTQARRDAGDAINVFANAAGNTTVKLSAAIASYTGNDGGDRVSDLGGVQTYSLGGEFDTLIYSQGSTFAGDTIDGGGGLDIIEFGQSMDFLGNSITNVEILDFRGNSDAMVTISGANAARLTALNDGRGGGFTQNFTIQLEAGSTTNLTFLRQGNFDARDAINVVSTSGSTSVLLNDQMASFTGSADSDTVSFQTGLGYMIGAVIDGGGGADRITYDGNADFDGGLGVDTLVVLESQIVNLASADFQIAAGGFVRNFENVDGSASAASLNLTGSALSNVLIGGSAADTISGGLGADMLTGGGGADIFVWTGTNKASDTITDFTSRTDKLAFNAVNFGVSGPAFDRVVVDTEGFADRLGSADLFITGVMLNSAVEVREYVNTENSTVSHGMFVVAPNSAEHNILYYTADASSLTGTGFTTAFFQIADLGTAPAPQLGDFVFI